MPISRDNSGQGNNSWPEYRHVVLTKLDELSSKAESHGENIHELASSVGNLIPEITLIVERTASDIKVAALENCDRKYRELDDKFTKKHDTLKEQNSEHGKSISNIKYAALGFGFAGAMVIWLIQFIVSRAVAHAG